MYSLKQTPGYFRLSASILSPFFLWRNIKEVFSFVWQFVYIFLLDFEGERAVVSFEERKKKKKEKLRNSILEENILFKLGTFLFWRRIFFSRQKKIE